MYLRYYYYSFVQYFLNQSQTHISWLEACSCFLSIAIFSTKCKSDSLIEINGQGLKITQTALVINLDKMIAF